MTQKNYKIKFIIEVDFWNLIIEMLQMCNIRRDIQFNCCFFVLLLNPLILIWNRLHLICAFSPVLRYKIEEVYLLYYKN